MIIPTFYSPWEAGSDIVNILADEQVIAQNVRRDVGENYGAIIQSLDYYGLRGKKITSISILENIKPCIYIAPYPIPVTSDGSINIDGIKHFRGKDNSNQPHVLQNGCDKDIKTFFRALLIIKKIENKQTNTDMAGKSHDDIRAIYETSQKPYEKRHAEILSAIAKKIYNGTDYLQITTILNPNEFEELSTREKISLMSEIDALEKTLCLSSKK